MFCRRLSYTKEVSLVYGVGKHHRPTDGHFLRFCPHRPMIVMIGLAFSSTTQPRKGWSFTHSSFASSTPPPPESYPNPLSAQTHFKRTGFINKAHDDVPSLNDQSTAEATRTLQCTASATMKMRDTFLTS